MERAHINPAVLRWATARAGMEVEDLGTAVRKPPEAIEAWLDGSARPTFKQAQHLAKRLRVPYGYLFLSRLPKDDLPIPDFRRMPGAIRRQPSVDLKDVITDVLLKQDLYRDYRTAHNQPPLDFVGRFSADSSTEEVAGDIRETLDFDLNVRVGPPGQLLQRFVPQVKAQEILVMRNGIVRQATNRRLDVNEFRGFSLPGPMAPVIFINNADSTTAQVFTLAHELAHLWIGQGGISDADPTIQSRSADGIQALCNRVAGELLVTWIRIRDSWAVNSQPTYDWVKVTSRNLGVSKVMVAHQLWDHDAITREEFFGIYQIERNSWERDRKGSGGGNLQPFHTHSQ